MKLNYYSLDRFPFLDTIILKSRLAWSIRLRWLAVASYFFATIAIEVFFKISLPYKQIWIILFSLAFLNLIYQVILLLIHYSGGIENPIYLFYIFHIVISSILFSRYSPFMIATLVVILFSSLVYLEFNEIINHYILYSHFLTGKNISNAF